MNRLFPEGGNGLRFSAMFMRGLPALVLLFVAVLVGGAIPTYVGLVGDSVGRLLVLPFALVIGIVFVVDKFLLLTLILLTRSAGDVFFETTKLSFGGLSIGLGGLINLVVLLIVASLIVESRSRAVFQGQRWWMAFLAVFAFGVLYAPVTSDAVRTLLAVVSYFAVFLAAQFYVERSGDIQSCVRIVLFSSFLPGAYALFDLATNLGGVSDFRLQSTFTHPNIFAFYLVTVTSLLLYVIKSPLSSLSARGRWGVWAYMILVLFLLLMTKTRSAWIACFAIFVIYALMFERRYLLYLCIAPFIALLIPSVQDRLLDLNQGNEIVQYGKLNSFAWRQLIWEDGLAWMEPLRYFAGYGVGAFYEFSPRFFSTSGGNNFGAHNVYVQLFFEMGIVGLLAFLVLLATIATKILGLRHQDRLASVLLMAVVVQYAVVCMSDNMLGYLAFNWYVFFIMGAGVAVSRMRTLERTAGGRPAAPEGAPC